MGKHHRYLILAPALLVAACGDDNGSGGSSADLNLPIEGSLPLSSLATEDLESVCESVNDAFSKHMTSEWMCTLAGLTARYQKEEDEAYCATVADMCLDNIDEVLGTVMDDVDLTCNLTSVDLDLSGCDVTVNQLERCFLDLLARISDRAGVVSCASPVSVLTMLDQEPELPASCLSLASTCAGLASGINP